MTVSREFIDRPQIHACIDPSTRALHWVVRHYHRPGGLPLSWVLPGRVYKKGQIEWFSQALTDAMLEVTS